MMTDIGHATAVAGNLNTAGQVATDLSADQFCSKQFADQEDNTLWTKIWVPVGLQQQIPAEGDLLPYTVGDHGIHVQRQADGSLRGRFNKAQHGGCRTVPEQCQTGSKTRCSYTSCGFSRDRAVIKHDEMQQSERYSHQYLGLTPERLLPVSVSTWQSIIMVNLNPYIDSALPAFPPELSGLKHYTGQLKILCDEWIPVKANWKLAAGAGIEAPLTDSAVPCSHGLGYTAPFGTAQKCSTPLAFADYPLLTNIDAGLSDKVSVFWLYPNLTMYVLPTHIVCVVTQPVALEESVQRVTIVLPQDSLMHASALKLDSAWLNYLAEQSNRAEQQHSLNPHFEQYILQIMIGNDTTASTSNKLKVMA